MITALDGHAPPSAEGRARIADDSNGGRSVIRSKHTLLTEALASLARIAPAARDDPRYFGPFCVRWKCRLNPTPGYESAPLPVDWQGDTKTGAPETRLARRHAPIVENDDFLDERESESGA